jgi:hypothetical protein
MAKTLLWESIDWNVAFYYSCKPPHVLLLSGRLGYPSMDYNGYTDMTTPARSSLEPELRWQNVPKTEVVLSMAASQVDEHSELKLLQTARNLCPTTKNIFVAIDGRVPK